MRKFLVVLLIFITIMNVGSERSHEARANPAVLLAPEAAVGMLMLLSLAVAAAYEIGTINRSQKINYQADIQSKINAIQAAVRRGLAASKDAVEHALETIVMVQAVVHTPGICSQVLARQISGYFSTSKTARARQATEGECEPDLRGDPYKCCPDFMRKFKKGGTMSWVGENAFQTIYYNRHGDTRRCCFEWDSLHGRFEVYTDSNHSTEKNHIGEKSCARSDDLDEDLCTANFPDKADFLSRRHQPRNGC